MATRVLAENDLIQEIKTVLEENCGITSNCYITFFGLKDKLVEKGITCTENELTTAITSLILSRKIALGFIVLKNS